MPASAAPRPALAWTQTELSLSAYPGTAVSATAEFTFADGVSDPGIKVVGPLASVVSVDIKNAELTSPGHAVAQIHIDVPLLPQEDYEANIQFTAGGKPLPQPLHITLMPKVIDPNVIPESIGLPSSSRVTTVDGARVITDQLVVRLPDTDTAPDQTMKNLAASVSGQVVGSLPGDNWYQLRVPGSTLDHTTSLQAQLAARPEVESVDVDVLASAQSYTNDPIWQPTPASHGDQNWNLEVIEAPVAWNYSTGSGVNVAVIDGGIHRNHADLSAQVAKNASVAGSNTRHGTHVAGTICATGNNSRGMVGVAYGCKLSMFAIAMDNDNNVLVADIIRRVDDIGKLWISNDEAVRASAPKVVNISIGFGYGYDCTSSNLSARQRQLQAGVINTRNDMVKHLKKYPGVLWVFSAGNEGNDSSCSLYGDLGNRSDLPHVMSVAASTREGTLPDYSVRGSGVSIAAPGGNRDFLGKTVNGIYSTLPPVCSWFTCTHENYGSLHGTSMAAPHVAGAAALAIGANEAMTPAAVKRCIVDGAAAAGNKIAGQSYYILSAKRTVDCALDKPNQQQGTLTNVQAIVPGVIANYAVKKDGTVWAWGNNYNGELGNGTTTASAAPVQVPGLTGVSTVSAGSGNAYALKKDGTVWGWGANDAGQLGNGTRTGSLAPVQIPGLPSISSVVTRSGSTYAISNDGSVWAWGNNFLGVLGNDTDVNALTPVRLEIPDVATEVRAGGYTAYILTDKGTVWSWGQNGQGQLGHGTTAASKSPVQVSGLSGVKSLVVSRGSVVYALMPDQTLKVWGEGSDGALGNGTFGSSSVPIDVPNVGSVAQVVAEPGYTFARLTNGTVLAWGNGWNGALGTGNTSKSATPTPVVGISSAVSIATDGSWSLALLSDGTVRAWGYGFSGTTVPVSNATPVSVSGLSGVSSVVASPTAAFAIKTDGSTWSWGGSRLGRQPTDTAPAGVPAPM